MHTTIWDIKVIPSSGKQGFKRDKSGKLVCNLKSAPERGAANAELIRYIADTCDLCVADITIIAGVTSRKKRIKIIHTKSEAELLASLGIYQQLMLL